jgi:hypothetical protein
MTDLDSRCIAIGCASMSDVMGCSPARAHTQQRKPGVRRELGWIAHLSGRLRAYPTTRFVRGFSADNLETMRRFYLTYGS